MGYYTKNIMFSLGSNLNQSPIVTDAMMLEDEDVYMTSEDEAEVYLKLVEEEI